ncbi:MAG: tRNA (guanosine(37)-N1)-methyltransferase TrmD [Candidatus Dormibacteraeota bacterium]|uniref:tRNA (guanine-N(1)-)-methyltransferase n=1 Tax=Candidatus Amunia macphersoniae TaxID=3127014 RepID=A0A934KSC8_9BACT|nr:tRNA (guanosine(37)-N1)-methyltransferase TrmD [Candidatus Dormibacteraeota bacterium]
MRFDVLTIFPSVFPGPLGVGVVGRALASGAVHLHVHDLREHSGNRHRQVDDMQFGGGAGMVLKPEPIAHAIRALRAEIPGVRTILLSPQGRVFTQDVARELVGEPALLLVCGRYQGVDERAREEIGDELSVGDYVLSGGEVAAMTVIEATARLVPGVVGSPESLVEETFSSTTAGGLEPPLYTRPAAFEGREVPAVLRSGDHAAIAAWRRQQSDEQTRRRRPDLVRLRAIPGGNE